MIDPKTGIDFPFFQSQVVDIFGDPTDVPFPETYLRTMDFSEFGDQFAHVQDFMGNPWNCKIYGNYVLENPLRTAFRALCSQGLAQELQTFDGCFNIRKMKGGAGYSMHSWGLAVDFNAALNPFGGPVNFSDEFIKCFANSGFEAGALWGNPDGMHFQIVWTSSKWLTSDNPLRPIPWVA
jgi:hypothetical protein